MDREIDVLLVGIGGYGKLYVNALLEEGRTAGCRIAGVVDTKAENCISLQRLWDNGVNIFDSLEAFYSCHTADLTVISSPIHFHCSQTCIALSKGSSVLCEKPVSATIQDALKMIESRNRSGKFVAIGYQWSYSQAVRDLKRDVIEGVLGRPIRLKSIVLTPRNLKYYSKSWAGRVKDSNGRWILDSVANNATAHYLHNMLYVLGKSMDRSAFPHYVKAELYRANAIENYDTAVIKVVTEEGVEIFHFASHASAEEKGVSFCYEFENATVVYGSSNAAGSKNIVAHFKDGAIRNYGDPGAEKNSKLWTCIRAVGDETGESIPCGIEAASSHTLCINGAQESMPVIGRFPEKSVKFDANRRQFWVEGLDEILTYCYDQWIMPSENGIPWAQAGKMVNMENYTCFNG